jgi:mRNA interferase MazF
MSIGDIVLIPFPFTDLTGTKNRPAVILISTDDDVTVCFISAQVHWKTEFDLLVYPSEGNGLKKESLIRLNKLATIDKDMIIGRLGKLDKYDIDSLNKKLLMILKLGS